VIIPRLHSCRLDLYFSGLRVFIVFSSLTMFHATCHCPSCDATSLLSRNGAPTGIRFTKHVYKAHQPRINREATDSLSSLSDVIGDTTENLGEGTAQIFTTALLDEGPDLDQFPSKLWTSRNDFQASRASRATPSSMRPSSAVHSLTDAVHCLATLPRLAVLSNNLKDSTSPRRGIRAT
jgi:hypothetical protein